MTWMGSTCREMFRGRAWMTQKNCWIDEFHIKVDWLLNLWRNGQSIELPSDLPRLEDRKRLAGTLQVKESLLSTWCPKPKELKTFTKQLNRPQVLFVRNVARIYGFAPPESADDDIVWRDWWANQWPSFTPGEIKTSQTNKPKAPTPVFQTRYLEALTRGALKF